MSVLASVIGALVVLLQTSGGQLAQGTPTVGTITVGPVEDRADPPEVARLFAEAVQHALLDANFLALPAQSQSRYLAKVTVTRRARGLVASDAGEAGPATSAGDWGARIRVTLPSAKTDLRGLFVTELKVEIFLRSNNRPVWSGSALTAQARGTRSGAPSIIAAKLADALIQRFPEALDGPLSVP